MELRKRSLIREIELENSKYTAKKQKKNFSTIKSQIEDLSGEIWFEIFAYFDGQSLINIFSKLNSFIESLLNDYRLPIHFNYFCSNSSVPYPLNLNQVVSLTINYSQIIDHSINNINSLVRLHSLSLININDEQLENISKFSFNNLHQISIESKRVKFIMKIILIYFPNVNRMILNSMGKEFAVKSCHHDKNQISQLEKLTLDGRIKLAKLARLWSFIPNLRSFSIINGGVHQCDYWMDEYIISHQKFPPNLTFIHINICDDDMNFLNLEKLIPRSIRYLIISGSIADDDFEDYLSSSNWIRLISNCSNKLYRIKLDLSSYFDPSDSSGLQKTLSKFRRNLFFRNTIIQNYNKNFMATDSSLMDTSSSTVITQSENNDSCSMNQSTKRKGTKDESSGINKRPKLIDMVFYDGNRHPAAVLHELRPEISSDKYSFTLEEIAPKQTRFRCSITIDQNVTESINATGVGRSKQLAKNMAAQQALIKLYPTYRPPDEAILSEDSDMYQQTRFIPTLPPSLQNDPTSLIDSIRKHLTTKAIAIKTPLQLFNEIFINNQRLNSSTSTKNRIELIDNEENLVLVRVIAMDQQFWGVSAAKSVAQNDACQQAIETLCNVSFRSAKVELIRALQSMNKITLPSEVKIDANNNNNNNNNHNHSDENINNNINNNVAEQSMTTELTSIPGVSSSFLIPNDDS
ncbi:unnamed protein product [Rotaria socialis]|uniref:DRBM domain-containing protein n=2 Tax=Rotaria socialis TaxID=392032 RepID=A0A820FKY4_9BILA|nr:unnamed protein product [Rotaria socialis]CAF4133964.1 unnamed protein product [Rotaria socialis]CAF4263744.1 unnamed protein product [Rotaria socialis]